jgi:hypothetical protein
VPEGSQPSPYPDNYLVEANEQLFDGAFLDAGIARYAIEIDVVAVKDYSGKQVMASHPDETKNNKHPLFNFIAVGPVFKKAYEGTQEYKDAINAKADAAREIEYSKKVDKLVIEKMRKSLKDPEVDALVASIQAANPKVK